MPVITIPCPACGSALKLPDTSLIGRKGRCPRCQHRFVLQLPETEDVPLELAEPGPRPVPPRPSPPMVGTSARWVPDEQIPILPQAPLPDVRMPRAARTPLPDANELPGGAEAPASAELPVISIGQPVTASTAAPAAVATRETDTVSRQLRPGTRRRRSKSDWWIMGASALLFGIITAVVVFVMKKDAAETAVTRSEPVLTPEYAVTRAERAASNASAELLSPTSGKPVPLDYLPFTPHVLCHLHPAELWKKERSAAELQALLSGLGEWLNSQITARTRFEPQDISELTFAINFGARMALPDVAAVVRLREPRTPTDLMKRFKGRLRPDPKVEVYEADDFAFLLVDRQTFVVAPLSLADQLAEARNFPALASPDLEPLIQASDRDRIVTVMFDVRILDSHREEAFIPEMLPLIDRFMLWLGDGVETVSWSLHPEPQLFMETLLHPTTSSSVVREQRQMQQKLNELPERMLSAVKRMSPGTAGARQMIGRFPAMLAALDLGTTSHVSPTCVRTVTLLPRQAAPNLAAGVLLTWNQSLLTSFEDDARQTKTDNSAVPDKVADRLRMSIFVDFRRMPLQEAFGYIGESIKTEVFIDGDALEAAGFTQNMEQTFNLGSVPASAALHAILLKYAAERDPLVVAVDETGKRLILSTRSKAEADKLAVFETQPADQK